MRISALMRSIAKMSGSAAEALASEQILFFALQDSGIQIPKTASNTKFKSIFHVFKYYTDRAIPQIDMYVAVKYKKDETLIGVDSCKYKKHLFLYIVILLTEQDFVLKYKIKEETNHDNSLF